MSQGTELTNLIPEAPTAEHTDNESQGRDRRSRQYKVDKKFIVFGLVLLGISCFVIVAYFYSTYQNPEIIEKVALDKNSTATTQYPLLTEAKDDLLNPHEARTTTTKKPSLNRNNIGNRY